MQFITNPRPEPLRDWQNLIGQWGQATVLAIIGDQQGSGLTSIVSGKSGK